MFDGDDKREMATNRLLDILRSQQADEEKPVSEKKAGPEPSPEPKADKKEVKKTEDQPASDNPLLIPDPVRFSIKKKKIPFVSSDAKPEDDVVKEPVKQSVSRESLDQETAKSVQEIRKKLGLLKKESEETGQGEKVETPVKSETSDIVDDPEVKQVIISTEKKGSPAHPAITTDASKTKIIKFKKESKTTSTVTPIKDLLKKAGASQVLTEDETQVETGEPGTIIPKSKKKTLSLTSDENAGRVIKFKKDPAGKTVKKPVSEEPLSPLLSKIKGLGGEQAKEEKKLDLKKAESDKKIPFIRGVPAELDKDGKEEQPGEAGSDPSVEEIQPVPFDESLITFLEQEDYKSTLQDYYNSFIIRFDESWRKVSLHADDQTLWMLQVLKGMKSTIVEKFKSFSLPYVTPDKTIQNMNELIGYVLDNEIDPKLKKTVYGAFYSSKLTSKTQVLQTPELNRKELSDLVDWNSRKNLPFPSEQSVANWEVIKNQRQTKKTDIVIGVFDGKALESVRHIFDRHGVRLRLVSTLPILLWKIFVKNYPDKRNTCCVLIHVGENHTIVMVVNSHRLLFIREIAIGTQDFYKAVMQKVESKSGKSIEIDHKMAKQILHQYGFPNEKRGYTVGSHINLYKISIFLRPVVERISGELNRSLNYFKKQNSDLIWDELLFDGIGTSIPNLVTTLRDNLNIDVSLLNPIRAGNIKFANGLKIEKSELPNYAVNFALVCESVRKLNILPKGVRNKYKNILLSKIAMILTSIFIPFVGISFMLSTIKINSYEEQIHVAETQWENMSAQTKQYFSLMGDIEIIQAYQSFLENDRILSENQIRIMKVISDMVPDEIKITAMNFMIEYPPIPEDSGITEFEVRPGHYVDITGFVTSDPSVANIQLANFRVDLQKKGLFREIKVLNEDISSSTSGKLMFTIRIKY